MQLYTVAQMLKHIAVGRPLQDDPPKGHYKFWIENNEHRVDAETPYSVRLTKDGKSEDKHFDDLEEYDEATAFEVDI